MSWNKFWEYAKNTAKTIWILILIGIGIRILWFVICSFITYKPFSPFETPDYNPLATIVGAIITGLITWFAVYKTSELDKKARKYERIYSYYQKELINLNNNLLLLKSINWGFWDDPKNYAHTLFKFKDSAYCDVSKTENIKNILYSLEVYDKKWRKEEYINMLENIIKIQKHFNNKLSEFLSDNTKNADIFKINLNNISYNIQNLTKQLDDEGIHFNYEKNKDLITEMIEIINNEFKLDEE